MEQIAVEKSNGLWNTKTCNWIQS